MSNAASRELLILLLFNPYVKCLDIAHGIQMGIELKKEVSEGHTRQAILELGKMANRKSLNEGTNVYKISNSENSH